MKKTKGIRSRGILATVNGGRTIATYRAGDIVFSQGHRCDGVFYIRSGDCKISVISEQGKEAVVALHKKGDFFGEGCLTGQPFRLATATAMNDLEVMRFALPPFSACFMRNQRFRKCSFRICSSGMRAWKLT